MGDYGASLSFYETKKVRNCSLESGLFRSSPRREGGARAPVPEQQLVIEPKARGYKKTKEVHSDYERKAC